MVLSFRRACLGCFLFGSLALGSLRAADEGWQVLFDGTDRSAWQSAGGGEPGAGWVVQDGALVRQERGGDIWTKQRFGDFVLELEYQTEGNSGVFIRTDNPRDNVQTGIEIQVDRPRGTPSKHSSGALYDLLAPSQTADRPAGEWNKLVVTAQGSQITVEMNGQRIIQADLDQWTEARKNPDGTPNKFNAALKDFKREGHIGLQDHGAKVAYRNIRVKPLGR